MDRNDWQAVMDALRVLAPMLGGWAIWLLRQVLLQLKTLNGRLARVEIWQETHEKLDVERFDMIHRQHTQLRGEVHDLAPNHGRRRG